MRVEYLKLPGDIEGTWVKPESGDIDEIVADHANVSIERLDKYRFSLSVEEGNERRHFVFRSLRGHRRVELIDQNDGIKFDRMAKVDTYIHVENLDVHLTWFTLGDDNGYLVQTDETARLVLLEEPKVE